jgi:hypothetical protein
VKDDVLKYYHRFNGDSLMNLEIRFFVGLFFLIIGLFNPLMAQQDSTSTDQLYMIELKDGSEIICTIEGEDSEILNVRTLSGVTISLPKAKIASRKELYGDVVGERYLRLDPNYTRLLFAPTARPLKSGSGYFGVYELFFAFVAVGVGDYMTLAGGMSLFPGAESQIFYLAPKITPFQTDNLDLAVGVLHLILPTFGGDEPATSDGDETEGLGIVYTNGTFGSQYAAVTVGLGWGYSGEDVTNEPILLIGGEVQISNSTKLITENWFPPNSDIGLLSLGIRFFGDKLSSDLGFFIPIGSGIEEAGFLPWVNFTYNFGQ